ncbi:MAG TPA: hypothetical protein DCL21_00230 [Alphaproteobacteria bacterium]|nr:hypothetical protein [Alphaproteobacteria bacterium]
MVLKRKLPTQEAKKDKVVEQEKQFDDFDMSIESDKKKADKKIDAGHDLNDDFPDQLEGKPEDFIPEELRALEADNPIPVEETPAPVKHAEKVEETPAVKEEQENEDILPVSFEESKDDFDMSIQDDVTPDFAIEEPKEEKEDFASPFEKADSTPAELPEPQEPTFDSFETEESSKSVEFETTEHANWEEVVDKSEHKDENFDSFDSIQWDNNENVETKTEVTDERFNDEEPTMEDVFSNNNDGIIPELPGMDDDFSKPAEVMGENSQELTLNSDAKKKLISALVVGGLAVGAIFVYSNMDTTTEVANRWSGSLTEATQDIAETEQEQAKLIEEGVDITKAEQVINLSELSSDGSDYKTGAEGLMDDSSETEINLLEPEVIEKTASGKEIIKATGEEKLPDDVEEGANLITNISAEIEKQKAARQGLAALDEEESKEDTVPLDDEGNPADINKKVDEQLAEYRKLLAHEEDPGKKVKPGAFFNGSHKQELEDAPESVNVAKIELSEDGTAEIPAGYASTSRAVDGHKIIEYPKGKARDDNEGIRTLDHFRSLIVEKEDKRVRIPRGVTPGMKDQGFPKFKVISIVPNYGLIGEYNGKKGILMIGDTFKGWELVGVYESYAEFKSDTRKHIISLK